MFNGMVEVVQSLDPAKFEVLGSDMQILNVKVAPGGGDQVKSEPGTMVYMEPAIKMSVDCVDCVTGCKRECAGAPPVMATFSNDSNADAVVGLTPNFPAKIIPLLLTPNVAYRCKQGAYMASYGQVFIDYNINCSPTSCCDGIGCIRQVVRGDGTAFLAAMGTLMTKELAAGERIKVDTDSVVAWTENAELVRDVEHEFTLPNWPAGHCLAMARARSDPLWAAPHLPSPRKFQ